MFLLFSLLGLKNNVKMYLKQAQFFTSFSEYLGSHLVLHLCENMEALKNVCNYFDKLFIIIQKEVINDKL